MKGVFTLLFVAFTTIAFAQGYNIKVNIEGYTESELYLANNYGDKQYVKDTVKAQADGSFVFAGEEALAPGIYLIVLAPNNDIFQILIDEGDQDFSVTSTKENPAANVKIEGSALNENFYAYLSFLGEQRPKAQAINERAKAADEAGDAAKASTIRGELKNINVEVEAYQANVIKNQPESLLALIIKSSQQIDVPEFSGENAEYDRYMFMKKHWFDKLDMADSRMVRVPLQFEKVNHYVEKMTVQHPDSIIKSVDYVLEMVKPAEETFMFYLIHFLNKYAASKVIGQDAVYVHIGEKYYQSGIAHWTEKEQLDKIIDNVKTLKPLLLGKVAPDLKLMEIDIEKTIAMKENEDEHKRFAKKRDFTLHGITSPYTVLFIWDPDCGHCKKSMPEMIAFHDKWNPRGVEMVALCTEVYKEMPKCAEMIKEKGMIQFLNAMDPYIQSKYKTVYDVRTTPQIYVLDENKEIIMKRLDATQLDEVFEDLMLNDEQLRNKL